jgi:arylsulfatase A-like enzyme
MPNFASKFLSCWLLTMIVHTSSAGSDSLRSTNKLDSSRPNIVFILADDLGYGDLAFLGQRLIDTPNLDKLAKEGMFFSQHYSGAPVCAPARSAFLTGLHTGHTPVRGNFEIQPEGQFPLPDSLVTLGQIMKQAGYKTGAFGKWGLGFVGTSGDPINQGFDQFFGYNCQRFAHRYYPDYLWKNQTKIELPGNGWTQKTSYAPDLIQIETLKFIEENKNHPFFLFMPIVIPHAELAAPEDEIFTKYRKKFGEEIPYVGPKGSDYGQDLVIPGYQSQPFPHATFAAMVERIDRYVGEVLAELEEQGLTQNTLVIFTSDNGAHQEGGADPDFFDSNGPFKGYKRDLYDGGIHVPLIVKWPGKVKPESYSDHRSAFWDWLPTLTEIASNQRLEGIDGISFLPTLLGQSKQTQHKYLYWEFHELGGRQAILKDGWKLVKLQVKDLAQMTVELYNLDQDPGETKNLAAAFPQKVKELDQLIQEAHQPNPVFKLFEDRKGD